jgi:hypothetical protein
MTLPDERIRAIRNTRSFLEILVNPRELKRIPKAVRAYARSLLKHYPTNFETHTLAMGKTNYFKIPQPTKQLPLKGIK